MSILEHEIEVIENRKKSKKEANKNRKKESKKNKIQKSYEARKGVFLYGKNLTEILGDKK
jgi:hypothetical protein